MKKLNSLFGTLFLIVSLLSACTLPANIQGEQAPSVRAWFDAPLPNSVFVPPNPCQIVAHGASPNGISLFELSINGAASSIASPDPQSSLVTLTQDCGVSEPGNYLLQVRVQDNAGTWSGYAQTSLTIAGGETQTPPAAPEETVTVTPTLTLTPTLTPTTEPSGGVSIEQVSTDLVYIGQARCGTLEVTITARAVAPQGINVVVLFYRFQSGNSSSEFQSLSMNPVGDDLYRRTLNPTSLLGGSVPFDQAVLQYQVVIQQNNGDTSLRTPVLSDITVQACGGVTSCSSFTNESSCTANGCNWVSVPGTVPLNECRNP
jgi:hypothetical protein